VGFLINDKFAPGFSLHNWNLERNRPRRYKEAKLFAQKRFSAATSTEPATDHASYCSFARFSDPTGTAGLMTRDSWVMS